VTYLKLFPTEWNGEAFCHCDHQRGQFKTTTYLPQLRSLENACHIWTPLRCVHEAMYKSTFTLPY